MQLGDETDLENRVKAELLERLTRFVEWPNLPSQATFVVGVLGKSPLAEHLQRVARDRGFKGRRAVVRPIAGPDEAAACHLLLIARDRGKDLGAILGRTRGRPILTVGDTAGYGEAGVIINLVTERGHVRFEIHAEQAKKSGLRVSPKLLRLGRVVGGER